METVLVTGCAGFIGANLVKKLLELTEYKIIGVDNFDPFYPKDLKIKRIYDIGVSNRFEFYEVDCRSKDIELIFSNNEISIVIHLAARAGVRASMQMPLAYVESDVVMTVNILEASRKYSAKRFILGSSSSVYGNL